MAQIYKIISQDDDDQDNNVKKEKRVSQDDDSILCILGDNTGIVKAMLPKTFAFIRQGNCIKLNKVNSEVI